MRNGVIAVLLIVLVAGSLGVGYFAGISNRQIVTITVTAAPNQTTVTSASTFVTTATSTVTFVSTEVQTTTRTVNTATTIIGGTPIPIKSVETGNVSIGGSPYTYAIAVNPNASRIYVADVSILGPSNATMVLTVIDAVSHAVVARVTLPGLDTSDITIDYKTGEVYALIQGGIAEINGTSNTVVGELPNSFGLYPIAFDSSTDTIYGSTMNGSLIGVDSHTGKVTANVSIGYWANDVLVNPQLNLIYGVGCSNQQGLACDSTVSVVNGTNAKLMNETTLGSAYYASATIDEKTGIVYVSGEAQLVALNPHGTVMYNYYPDTCGPFTRMADDPALNQIIMAPQNYNYILVYNGLFGNLLNMYSLPDVPQYVAFNPATNETYAVVSGSLLAFHGVASTGHVNDTLIDAGQICQPV